MSETPEHVLTDELADLRATRDHDIAELQDARLEAADLRAKLAEAEETTRQLLVRYGQREVRLSVLRHAVRAEIVEAGQEEAGKLTGVCWEWCCVELRRAYASGVYLQTGTIYDRLRALEPLLEDGKSALSEEPRG